jgi:hypothetical protein
VRRGRDAVGHTELGQQLRGGGHLLLAPEARSIEPSFSRRPERAVAAPELGGGHGAHPVLVADRTRRAQRLGIDATMLLKNTERSSLRWDAYLAGRSSTSITAPSGVMVSA